MLLHSHSTPNLCSFRSQHKGLNTFPSPESIGPVLGNVECGILSNVSSPLPGSSGLVFCRRGLWERISSSTPMLPRFGLVFITAKSAETSRSEVRRSRWCGRSHTLSGDQRTHSSRLKIYSLSDIHSHLHPRILDIPSSYMTPQSALPAVFSSPTPPSLLVKNTINRTPKLRAQLLTKVLQNGDTVTPQFNFKRFKSLCDQLLLEAFQNRHIHTYGCQPKPYKAGQPSCNRVKAHPPPPAPVSFVHPTFFVILATVSNFACPTPTEFNSPWLISINSPSCSVTFSFDSRSSFAWAAMPSIAVRMWAVTCGRSARSLAT
jgi:hypothetical protein